MLNSHPPFRKPAGKNKNPATIFNLMNVIKVEKKPNFEHSGVFSSKVFENLLRVNFKYFKYFKYFNIKILLGMSYILFFSP